MSSKKPLISVLTATWNREKYLKILTNSLKKQTYKNFEWIIGNDGSEDGTEKFIKSLSKKVNFKIIYINSTLRIGKTSMLNLLYTKVKGKYLVECDSDDFFVSKAFENFLNLIKKNNLDNNKNFGGILAQNFCTKGSSQTFKKIKTPKKDELLKWEIVKDKHDGDGTIFAISKNYKNKRYAEVDFLVSESSLLNNIYKNKIFLLTPKKAKIMNRLSNNSTTFSGKIQYTRGWVYSIALNEKLNIFNKKKILSRILIVINYWRYSLHGEVNFYEALKMLKPVKENYFYTLLYPISYLISLRDLLLNKVRKTHIEFEKNKKISKVKIEILN